MFKRRGTIIAEGLKIKVSVSAEGLVEVNGQIEGDVHCTSLFISPKAVISGGVEADRVVVNGKVEGPIRGSDTRMSWATFNANIYPSNAVRILMGIRHARPKPTCEQLRRGLPLSCVRRMS
jgi:hypothetical protein